MKKIISAAVLALSVMSAKAQHHEVSDKPEMYKGKQHVTADTTSLLHAFKSGSFRGHFRYFFMSTQNSKGLTDYYANAAGGGIRYETAKFHHFQFAVSGFYIFNIGSSDFTKPDTLTGQNNRYEIGLFDITDPLNKKDLDRLEEFYLKYNYKNSTIILGRQLINTPFINLQDGRMRATGVEGLWAELNPTKKVKIETGWLYGVSPRSTTKWYSPGESIGIYPSGVNPDGTKSQYNNNTKSKTVALLGFTGALHKKIKLQVWNMFTANVFNTAMLQADFSFPLKNNASVLAAAQIIKQDAVNDGGNPDQSKTYFLKGGRSLSFGAKAGWKNKQWETSLNYNRITKAGRYLMPREWGRDPFFTFLPRERNDGLGDVNAVVGKVNYNISKARLKIAMAAGYYQLPDVKNYTLNKYGLPSYTQINIDIRYTFDKVLQGLEAQFLLAEKSRNGETYNNSKFVINKVNMVQYNFVLNYHF
jgi:hypothetical protein